MRQRKICMIVMLIFIIGFGNSANADYLTTLTFSGYIQSGTGDLDAGNWSAPTVYDWDNDGVNDLLVGRKGLDGKGYVSFYKNYGTPNSPSFNGYTDIQACSVPACTNGGG